MSYRWRRNQTPCHHSPTRDPYLQLLKDLNISNIQYSQVLKGRVLVFWNDGRILWTFVLELIGQSPMLLRPLLVVGAAIVLV